MRSSVHIDNKSKNVLILGEGTTKGLIDTTLTAEAIYLISFTQPNKRLVLILHYNESKSFLFVKATKLNQIKTKNSEVKDYALCLGNISKDFTINNFRKTGLKGVVNFFPVDFNPIETNYILDIQKHLMKSA